MGRVMQYYSNRKYTVAVVEKVDGIVKLQDIDGHTYVVSEERFNAHYVPIKREERKKFNMDDTASGYVEMGNIVTQTSNDNYIFEVPSNKPF
jgi:hypothetical protein